MSDKEDWKVIVGAGIVAMGCNLAWFALLVAIVLGVAKLFGVF